MKYRRIQENENCVYLIRDCSHEDIPTVTDDCGINDRVVRAWSQTSYGNTADPITPQRAAFVGVCEDDD